MGDRQRYKQINRHILPSARGITGLKLRNDVTVALAIRG